MIVAARIDEQAQMFSHFAIAPKTATKMYASRTSPVLGSVSGTVCPAWSTKVLSPARCSWRMTCSPNAPEDPLIVTPAPPVEDRGVSSHCPEHGSTVGCDHQAPRPRLNAFRRKQHSDSGDQYILTRLPETYQ
jgi:hypothetical protein